MALKTEICEEITTRIMDAAESDGVLVWHKPWTGGGLNMPKNPTRNIKKGGARYNGINVLILWSRGFSLPLWAGYKQWAAKGAQVQKGEKGTRVVVFKPYECKKTGRTKFFAGTAAVFNIEQTDANPADFGWNPTPKTDAPRVVDDAAEAFRSFIAAEGIDYKEIEGGGRAFYRPSTDAIRLPSLAQFETTDGYHRTQFHEGIHATGHKDRLDRFGDYGTPSPFGSEEYSREELVAEMGSAFLCAHYGLDGQEVENGSAAYVRSWSKHLRANPRYLIDAAQGAEKAASRILAAAEAKVVDETATVDA